MGIMRGYWTSCASDNDKGVICPAQTSADIINFLFPSMLIVNRVGLMEEESPAPTLTTFFLI